MENENEMNTIWLSFDVLGSSIQTADDASCQTPIYQFTWQPWWNRSNVSKLKHGVSVSGHLLNRKRVSERNFSTFTLQFPFFGPPPKSPGFTQQHTTTDTGTEYFCLKKPHRKYQVILQSQVEYRWMSFCRYRLVRNLPANIKKNI